MTFKLNAVKRTVTGTFQRPDGTAAKGKILIKLLEPVSGRQEDAIYTRQEVEIELDENGTFSRDLAATSPGLTITEKIALGEIQDQIENEAAEMITVQEDINVYLKKIYDNEPVTEADVLDHKNNLARKIELQESASELKRAEKVYLDKQKELEDAAVVMRIRCNFSNPKDRSTMFVILPPGDDPVDIADLPRR